MYFKFYIVIKINLVRLTDRLIDISKKITLLKKVIIHYNQNIRAQIELNVMAFGLTESENWIMTNMFSFFYSKEIYNFF